MEEGEHECQNGKAERARCCVNPKIYTTREYTLCESQNLGCGRGALRESNGHRCAYAKTEQGLEGAFPIREPT
jgi:hypothetical protein